MLDLFEAVRFNYFDYDYASVERGANIKILARLVGYLEYEQSLKHFQHFLAAASPEEAVAADALVRQRDELAIYTNLSRFVEPVYSVLAEKSDVADDNYERRGLEWLIAVARLEHQAALVGFTASRSPLTAAVPVPQQPGAYEELVADGALLHYAAWRAKNFKQEPDSVNSERQLPPPTVERAVDKLKGADLIAEGRRAALTLELIDAAMHSASAEETAEWQRRRKELDEFKNLIVQRIRDDDELLRVAEIDAPRLVRVAGQRDRRRDDREDDD